MFHNLELLMSAEESCYTMLTKLFLLSESLVHTCTFTCIMNPVETSAQLLY